MVFGGCKYLACLNKIVLTELVFFFSIYSNVLLLTHSDSKCPCLSYDRRLYSNYRELQLLSTMKFCSRWSSENLPYWGHFQFCPRVRVEIKTMNVSCMFQSPSTKYFVLRHLEKCHTTFSFSRNKYCSMSSLISASPFYCKNVLFFFSTLTFVFVIQTKRRDRGKHAGAVSDPSNPHMISKSLQSSLRMNVCHYEP